jgi:hypothetical protein
MRSNNLYIVILVIIFIFLYAKFGDKLRSKLSNNTYDNIMIDIKSNVVKTDINGVVDHLLLLKDNFLFLNKIDRIIDKSDMIREDSLIKTCIFDLNAFKTANDFNDQMLKNDSNHYTQYLYGKLQESSWNMLRDDITDYQYEKYELMDIITNIDIVILLIKSGRCKGVMKLTNLHNLIKLCSILSNIEYLRYDEIFNINDINDNYIKDNYIKDDVNNYISQYTNDYGVPHSTNNITVRLNKSNNSQNNDEQNDIAAILCDRNRVVNSMPVTMVNYKNTQYLPNSEVTYNTDRKGIVSYIPFCDITKILEERSRDKSNIVDSIAKRSLRNDYNF